MSFAILYKLKNASDEKSKLTIVLSDSLPLSGHLVNSLSWHFLCTAVWHAEKNYLHYCNDQNGFEIRSMKIALILRNKN